MEEERPVIDMSAIIGATFSSGGGKLVIDPALTDEDIGGLVRTAMDASEGQPFTVIQSVGSVILGDLKDVGAKFGGHKRFEGDS